MLDDQPQTLPDLLRNTAQHYPDVQVLAWRDQQMSAQQLWRACLSWASLMKSSGIKPGDRVAIWLPKQFETVIAMWAASLAGAVFIPVNPGLKPAQVLHILTDSGAQLLVSSRDRCHQLDLDPALICWSIDAMPPLPDVPELSNDIVSPDALAAILYTSGSTGKPKGVMLSHANLSLGAKSVAHYLKLTPADRLLCVLPLSFDYGLNQVTTALFTGAQAVLFDYLLPRDVLAALARYRITGLAGVPALWSQLLALDSWPEIILQHLRYITNSGGRMPKSVLDQLVSKAPQAEVYLMYGLTEAFRSTCLDPALVQTYPDSVGTAIPYAEVKIVRSDGRETSSDEIGELVHMGPLVAQGYWRDALRTAERFRPAPICARQPGSPAVWSGDKARRDSNGLIYFIARDDEMIKSSGYRISPTEIEEILYALPELADVVVLGVPDDRIGEAVVAVMAAKPNRQLDINAVMAHCRLALPAYMVPSRLMLRPDLPRNANGKLDRSSIATAVRAGEWS
jgi:acyl-CoA ligase (AMP-forming) (exosortase A-associated)